MYSTRCVPFGNELSATANLKYIKMPFPGLLRNLLGIFVSPPYPFFTEPEFGEVQIHDQHSEHSMNSQTASKSVYKVGTAYVSLLIVILFWNCGTVAQSQSAKPQTKTEQQQTDDIADVDGGQHVGIERAYPRLRFNRPVYLTGAGDGSGRLFVIEHAGIVRWFSQTEENPTSLIFLDISDRVSRRGNEEGLNGFAFHPKFKDNGFVYCHYSSDHQRTGDKNVASSIISRFKLSNDQNVVDPTSEKVLLTIPQPFENHNGGAMAFGNDGYLYFSLGDGGGTNPMGNGQRLSSMHGAINRIDVDSEANGKPYGIPADNPFVSNPQAASELFAIGLRNVWRFSIDRKTGELWAGEVGQQRTEEVNIVQKGGNYGWDRYEAIDDYKKQTKLAIDRHDKPVAWYDHKWGGSITGGNVYRGKKFPVLDGSYFFGDYMSGNLWRTRKDKAGNYQTELVRRTGRSITSFGEDDEGEIFMLSFDGGIYRIVLSDKPEDTFKDWPVKLSETGLFTSLTKLTPAEHLIAYEVNAPLWSDNAEKSRFFVLPEGSSLGFRSNGSWEIPVGATIVKNFIITIERKKRILETRLIKRTDDGWEAATYVWDRKGKDAELLPNGKQVEIGGLRTRQSWHAPSSSECASCHVESAGYVLGLSTAQLNRDSADGNLNQIRDWIKKGIVHLPANVNLNTANRFCSPYDENADLEARARVWLDVNCAMCHHPEGPGNAKIDLRYATSLEETQTIDVNPAQGDLGIVDAKLIAPGHPERSLMLHRIETLGEGRMPIIGSNLIDTKAVKLLNDWIRSMR